MTQIIYKEGSATHCHIDTYPDGQRLVTVDLDYFPYREPVTIKCRIKRYDDFEILDQIIWALKINNRYIKRIDFIYLLGLRSDRIFQKGQMTYTDLIRQKIISYPAGYFSVYYPHNELTFIDMARLSIDHYPIHRLLNMEKDYIFIAGDSSFRLEHTNLLHYFDKKRTPHGIKIHLNRESMSKLYDRPNDPVVIIDDLCDGGNTFIQEAKYLKEFFPYRELSLCVAHGIFSQGLDPLFEYFDHIYTTNSYQDFQDDESQGYMELEKLIVKEVI